MICPRDSGRGLLSVAFWMTVLPLILGGLVQAQPPAAPGDTNPGQFFTITEPITDKTLEHGSRGDPPVRQSERASGAAKVPVLVFEFRPGETAPGRSNSGPRMTSPTT